jgi:cysteine desulfurase family protein (TIGR01976 family)
VSYDVTGIRAQFPALAAGIAHFDGPGGTQTPQPVIQAVYDALAHPLSNRGHEVVGEANAEAIVVESRRAMADLLAADPAGIVFGRSATQLTYDFSRTLAKGWAAGDEVVVTRLDHDSNIRPWIQAAQRAGATVRWAGFDPATGELTADDIRAVLSERTRLVAVTAASNLIGTRPDVAGIVDLAHEAGALVYVDGVHYTAHCRVSLEELHADFVACSPYKFLGPHCGVLAASPELLEGVRPDKLLPSSNDVPERFELGTLPYELLAGTAAAVDFLADLAIGDLPADAPRRERLTASLAALESHEDRLRERIEERLLTLPGVRLHSRAARRTPTLLATFADHDGQDVRRFLAERGVNAPAGSFYAYEASQRLGLGTEGGLRIGLAPYNDDDDVDRLLSGLEECLSRG